MKFLLFPRQMIVLKGQKRLLEEGSRSLGAELESCEPWDMGAENSGPLKEQQSLFTT